MNPFISILYKKRWLTLAFLGTLVEPGTHQVLFRFRRPWHYWSWALVSLVSLVATAAVLVATRGSGPRGPGLLDEA